MGKRTPLLLLIVATLLAATIGSITAIAVTPGTASACSLLAPQLDVWPSGQVQPGDRIEINGMHFYDLIPHEIDPNKEDLFGGLCDFDTVPMARSEVWWNDGTSTVLGAVEGSEFTLVTAVPIHATAGPAYISVGGATADITVGPHVDPPPPPPCLAAISMDCPCPLYPTQSSTSQSPASQTAPGPDVAPGYLPPCPEPCPDYAHTIDDTTADSRWDCPDDPCGYEVNPGARAENLVWCPPPPPEPCELVDGDAYWCPPPPPEPCELVGDDAYWCPPPPPEFCPWALDAPDVATDSDIWCPPEPCAVNWDDTTFGGPRPAIGCPEPCELVGGDAIWCPEPPVVAPATASVPAPAPNAPAPTAPASTAPAPTADQQLDTASFDAAPATPATVAGSSSVSSNPWQMVAHRITRLVEILRAAVFG